MGDAAGTGHWCGHEVRFPGVALTTCLITAELAAHSLSRRHTSPAPLRRTLNAEDHRQDRKLVLRQEQRLRLLNTESVLEYQFGEDGARAADHWLDRLTRLPAHSVTGARDLYELSVLTALACGLTAGGANEPLHLNRMDVAAVLRQATAL